MTIKQAIERLNFMIQQHICYEEVVLEDDNEDAQEELHETEVELEALRMAVQALEEKPRWIPCAERLPSDENKTFVFLPDNTELGACVKIAQICDVKEVPKMPKMYEIWKDENGKAHGSDCKTGRVFAIGASAFNDVDMCAHKIRVGDTVYIKNEINICPHCLATISKAAKDLNDNAVMLRYAYGYMPAMKKLQGSWTVLWMDVTHAVIEREGTGIRNPIILCVPRSNLAIKGAEGDSKRG